MDYVDNPSIDSIEVEALVEAGIEIDAIDFIVRYYEGDYDADAWLVLLRLKTGAYAGIEAWCDYTGWDCQAGAEVVYGDTIEDVLFDSTAEFRQRLGYEHTPKTPDWFLERSEEHMLSDFEAPQEGEWGTMSRDSFVAQREQSKDGA